MTLVGQLDVVVIAHASCHVCQPFGELEASTAEAFRAALAAVAGLDRVVIDLGGVPFIDSAGLAVLIGAVRRIRDAGGDVAIACGRPPLLRLLRTAGVDRIVDVTDDVDVAVDALLAIRAAPVSDRPVPPTG